MKNAYLVFLLGLFIASPAFAHKVPFKEKYYLNLANGDGYKAMKLKNFCTGKNEEACRKQLGLWKIDPARIDAVVSCEEEFGRHWKFDSTELKPSIGIWNTGYYAVSDKIKDMHRFTWGPMARKHARGRELVQKLVYVKEISVGGLSKESIEKYAPQLKSDLQKAYDNPIYQVEPNQICFKDEEYCQGDELAVANTSYEWSKKPIPQPQAIEASKDLNALSSLNMHCVERRYKILTSPDRDKILQAESEKMVVNKQKELLLAEQEICDAAYFGNEFCEVAKGYFENLRILR